MDRHVLLVAGDPAMRARLHAALAAAPGALACRDAAGDDEIVAHVRETPPEVILLHAPSDALTALDHLVTLVNDHAPDTIPVVVIGAERDDADVMDAYRRGADDYLVACDETLGRLAHTLDTVVARNRHRACQAASALPSDEPGDAFRSHVSHELRTPLAAIYQFLSLVHDGVAGPTNAEQKEYLATALASVERLEDMIDALVDAQAPPAAPTAGTPASPPIARR